MNNKIAFIVGNGASRQQVNLELLVDKAPIYGCNAIYRDFHAWNYLIAIDDGMIEELRRERVDRGLVIIPPEENRFEDIEYSPHRRRANAGMIAMDQAIRRGANILYNIGIDFVLKGNISTDNVYKNTENYGPETHATQDDNYHRIRYLEWFARRNSSTKFVFVVPDDIPMRVIETPNVVGMKMSTFKNKLD